MMLRNIGKFFKGSRSNGGLSVLEPIKGDEEVDVTRGPASLFCQSIKQSADTKYLKESKSNFTGDSERNETEQESSSSKDNHQSFRNPFSVRDALGWGSVAAISLNACHLAIDREKTCKDNIPSYLKKSVLGSLAKNVLAQPAPQPSLNLPYASKFYCQSSSDTEDSGSDSPDVRFYDGSDSEDDIWSSRSKNTELSHSSDSSVLMQRKSKPKKVDLDKQIEENLQALREIEGQLLRDLDSGNVANHAFLLNSKIHLTPGDGPFAVLDPFDDPDRNAFLCFKENSRLGVASAIYNLAVCYERGIGTERDMKLAVKLYKQAAEAGHALAQYNLGALCLEGKVPDRDSEAGLALIRKAAKAGVEEAWSALLEFVESKNEKRKSSVSDCHDDLTKGLGVLFKTAQKSVPHRKPRRSASEPYNLDLMDTGYSSAETKASHKSRGVNNSVFYEIPSNELLPSTPKAAFQLGA